MSRISLTLSVVVFKTSVMPLRLLPMAWQHGKSWKRKILSTCSCWISVCLKCRGYQTPVILLTALRTTDDIVMGLQAGADDYIAKPFKFMELVARIEAHLRRKAENEAEADVTCADLRLDAVAHKAKRGDVETILSVKEFRLLEYFVRHQGEILTRKQLLKDVWDKDFDTNTNVVDVYVRYLRSKIDAPFDKKLIKTIVGKGYMMSDDDAL